MTAYFLFNTTQLNWADILCRMSLMVQLYQVQYQIRDTYKQIQ